MPIRSLYLPYTLCRQYSVTHPTLIFKIHCVFIVIKYHFPYLPTEVLQRGRDVYHAGRGSKGLFSSFFLGHKIIRTGCVKSLILSKNDLYIDKNIYSRGPFIICRHCLDIDCKRVCSSDFKAELIPYMENWIPPNWILKSNFNYTRTLTQRSTLLKCKGNKQIVYFTLLMYIHVFSSIADGVPLM
jgi:hypothetical protein